MGVNVEISIFNCRIYNILLENGFNTTDTSSLSYFFGLARILHETVYRNSSFIKINLGNYNTQGALNSLIGSPKGFFGSERGGELSNKIKNSDSKIIYI
jgi:hypothetical protein